MYILIINFKADITHDEYEEIAGKDAPIFANIPGLKHKYFLFNHETKIFGGCYLWEDKTSLDAYKAGDIYKSIIKITQILKMLQLANLRFMRKHH